MLLRKSGYRILPRLRIRTWRPDLVGLRGDEVVVVEAKGRGADIRKGLAQVALYSTDATSAYLALPSELVRPNVISAAKVLGIGIIGVGKGAKIELEAIPSAPRAAFLKRIRESRRGLAHSSPETVRKPASPAIARLLKHRRILEALFAREGRRFTIRELSQEANTSYSTTWRIVRDLSALGAILTERVGASQSLSLNQQAPVVQELRNLAGLELSPHRLAAKDFASLLAHIPEVQRVVLFGSVARKSEAATSDVDVAVIMPNKDRPVVDRIYNLAQTIQDRTRMRIVPLFVKESDVDSTSRLARSIRAGEVLLERSRGS